MNNTKARRVSGGLCPFRTRGRFQHFTLDNSVQTAYNKNGHCVWRLAPTKI